MPTEPVRPAHERVAGGEHEHGQENGDDDPRREGVVDERAGVTSRSSGTSTRYPTIRPRWLGVADYRIEQSGRAVGAAVITFLVVAETSTVGFRTRMIVPDAVVTRMVVA